MIAEQWKKQARDPVLCDTEAKQMPEKKGCIYRTIHIFDLTLESDRLNTVFRQILV